MHPTEHLPYILRCSEQPWSWRREWLPTPVFLRENSMDRGYSPWGHKESDTTRWLHLHFNSHERGHDGTRGVGDFNPHLQQQTDHPDRKLIKEAQTLNEFSSVQLLRCVWLFATPWIAARQASLSITISRSSLKLKFIESVMPSSHLILCGPLLLLPPIPPSIRVFSKESTLQMRWPKYWSFSFSIIPSKEHPGLISFRMDWLDLLAVQGTLKSLLQNHSWKASILRCSAFFTAPTLTSIHDHWKNHSLD